MNSSRTLKKQKEKVCSSSIQKAIPTASLIRQSKALPSVVETVSGVSSSHISTCTDATNQNLEDLTIIWLDANINNTTDCLETKAHLRSLINYLRIFDILDECTNFIRSATKETLFLVVSGSFGETILAQVHDLHQLSYVYVFCSNKVKHEFWAKFYSKTRGVFNDKAEFFSKLMADVKIYSQNSLPVSFLTNDTREKSVRSLTDEKARFIWYQWLMETLIRMPQSSRAKIDMLEESRSQYAGNASELETIKEFEDAYMNNTTDNAIWWYTRQCFLFRVLNKALRTENIDIIFKYRFFLKHLYEKLCELHTNCSSSDIKVVYRGQAMSIEEIQILIRNIDGLISLNTFVSTSQDNGTAISFAQDAVRNRPNVEPVIFEISLQSPTASSGSSQPYANIAEYSFYKSENEVLLSLGTVCQVNAVNKPCEENSFMWYVKLTMKDKDNEQLKSLKQYIGLEIREQPTIGDFGILFLKLGDLVRAEHYFAMMIKESETYDTQNMIDRCELHNNMGFVHAQKGNLKESLSYYQTALQLNSKAQSTGRMIKILPTIYSNIGYSYLLLKDWNAAMRMYEKALHHFTKEDHPDDELRGTIYLNMATTALSLGNIKLAEEYCEKALNSWQKCLSDDHMSFARLYRVQGQIALVRGQYQSAIQHQNNVLILHFKTLPSDHIQIAETYEDFATIYSKMNDNSSQSLEYYHKALEIYLKALPFNHPTICHTYIKLGELHQTRNENEAALAQYKSASRLSSDVTQTDLHITSLIKIVYIYLMKKKIDVAFRYALEAIEVTIRTMSVNSSERPILRQILPLFRTIGIQPPPKISALYKMAEKLLALSPIREMILNPIFSTCTANDKLSNMAAVGQLELEDQKILEAMFKEDSIEWNEIKYT